MADDRDNIVRLFEFQSSQREWLSDYARTPPVLANALIGMREMWPDAIAYDEMLCAPMLHAAAQGENDFTPRPLTDIDVGVMQERLQQARA